MSNEAARNVMPIVTVDSVDDARRFYHDECGFTRVMGVKGQDGKLDMATLALDGARLMFTRPRTSINGTYPSGAKRPVDIYLEVANVETYYAILTTRHVKISDPLTLQWWGDKTFKVTDPFGYEVWFYQTFAKPQPPLGVTLV